MATGHEAEVIRYLRRKSSSGFESPTYLGAEQRFVGALRNSSVNNLEEQYTLGTDTYIETYVDAQGNKIVETSYHINDAIHSLTDYYKIISTTYTNGITNEDFFFYIPQSLFETKEDKFEFSKLRLIRICEEGLEIRGGQVGVKVLEFLQTPTTNLSKISKNGKSVQLKLVNEVEEGLITVKTYKAIT